MPLINLVYFQQNVAFGATEHYLFDLAMHMDRKKFRVHVVCPDNEALDSFDVLQAHDVIVHRYPESLSTGNVARGIYGLQGLFRKIKPTLVHFNDICIRGLLAGRWARVPILVMTHHTPELYRRYNAFGHWAERLALKALPYIILTSEQSREWAIKNNEAVADRSQAIAYGLRPLWFQKASTVSR